MAGITLNISETSLVQIALYAWVARCHKEAEDMTEMADRGGDEYGFTAETVAKCRANARASLDFKAEANTLLERIKANR